MKRCSQYWQTQQVVKEHDGGLVQWFPFLLTSHLSWLCRCWVIIREGKNIRQQNDQTAVFLLVISLHPSCVQQRSFLKTCEFNRLLESELEIVSGLVWGRCVCTRTKFFRTADCRQQLCDPYCLQHPVSREIGPYEMFTCRIRCPEHHVAREPGRFIHTSPISCAKCPEAVFTSCWLVQCLCTKRAVLKVF